MNVEKTNLNEEGGGTYAAVAANTSTRRACVIKARASEKNADDTTITPSLTVSDFTKKRMRMDRSGSKEAMTVVRISTADANMVSL